MSLLAITDAGVLYKDAVFAGEEVQNITRVIFRNVTGLIPEATIDLTQGVPTSNIVHSQPIERVGALDDNAVVMSTVLGYDIGDFEYNWYGVIAQKADLSEVLIAVVQTPVQTKTKTNGPITGNYSTKSVVWKTANIAQSLNVNLSALPWQTPDNTFVTQAAYDIDMSGIQLFSADNLDNYASNGTYKWTEDLPDNAPIAYAMMEVSNDGAQPIQKVWGGSYGSRLFIRRRTTGTWDAWTEFSKVGHTHTPAEIGALAVGAKAVDSSKLGGQPLAYFGKQTDVDALSSVVFSDDTALDEIQEIVEYIKLNRNDLDTLSIASIAGLVTALAGKLDKTATAADVGARSLDGIQLFSADNLDDYASNGTYKWAENFPDNAPIAYALMEVSNDGAQPIQKVWGGSYSSRLFIRRRTEGTWDAWTEFSKVGHTHTPAEIGALAVGAKAADSSKLEGSTKASVIASARSGLAVAHSHPYLASSGKAADSSKLEGSTKASVIASARSGLALAHSHPYAASSHTHAVTRTTLLSSASGITTGNLSLSGWQNYDMLEAVGVDANDNRATTNFHTPSSLIQGLVSASDGKYVLWDNGSGAHWWIKGYTSSSLTYDSDNARILRIVGIKFTA